MNSRAPETSTVATTLFDAGFVDLVCVIPPGAAVSPASRIDASQLGKCPGKLRRGGWSGYPFTLHRPHRGDVEEWEKWGANIGLLAEWHPALDIDSEDEGLTELVMEIAEEHLGPAPVRRSRAHRRLLPYGTDQPFKGLSMRIVLDGVSHSVEFLGAGQQYIVAGEHPSGSSYEWEDIPLWQRRPEDLSIVSRRTVDDFFEHLKSALESLGAHCTYTRGRGNGRQSREVPQAELEAPSPERLAKVVSLIPNTTNLFPARADFIKMGIAIKAAGGDPAFGAYLDWCSRWDGGTNDPDLVEREWSSFAPPYRVGYPWLLKLAGLNDAHLEFESEEPQPDLDAATNPRLAALRELNESFAVVQVGSQVRILQERAEGIELLRADDFRLLLNNRTVPHALGAVKTEPLANAWLKWSGRRGYDRLVFRPGQLDCTPEEYNRWRGWNVEACAEGSCDLFLAHLREVVCAGDTEACEWLLDFLAHLFQFPQEKLGHVVAIRGAQGAGKSIVGGALQRLLGRHLVVAEKSDHVVGHFNGHLEECLVLQCEEAFWGGSRQAAGALKHLVTGEYLPIERKFQDARQVRNFTRVIITTNEDWMWPTSIDDRRLVAFEASSVRVGNFDYFERLFAELESGGYEKLLHTLLAREIDREHLRHPPAGAALLAQAAESLSPEEAWLHSLLEAGEIDGSVEPGGTVRVTADALHQDYLDTHSHRRYAKNQKAFGIWIAKHLNPEKLGRVRIRRDGDSVRTTQYRLPPLVTLRAQYSARGRGANQEWEEPHTWSPIQSFPSDPLDVDFGGEAV